MRMKMNRVNLADARAISLAVKVLKNGGVVMHPTETCYGLAADIFNRSAVEKVYALKGRDFKKPLSILVDSLGMAQEYAIFSDLAFDLASKYWPGPLSIVLPRKKKLPIFLNPDEDFISLRFSNNAFCKQLVEKFGAPLTTTSANRAGKEPYYKIHDVMFDGKVDLIVDGGILLNNRPSTIVKVDGERVEILRQGDLVIGDF